MVLEKLINVNTLFDTIIGSNIAEYDIRSAGATAIRELKGESIYNNLMLLDKKTRNINIGLMMRDEKGLSDKVNDLMLKYLNTFIRENKIKNSNLIYTTRDSIVIYNKLPLKYKFGNVEFSNKDGIFSSMYRIKNLVIFFDSMRGKIMVKGVNDEIVEKSKFFQKFLVKYLFIIENCQNSGDGKIFNTLHHMRESYIRSPDLSIYRDIMNENRFCLRYNDDRLLYVDNEIEEEETDEFTIAREMNYVNIILPIMRSVLLNG